MIFTLYGGFIFLMGLSFVLIPSKAMQGAGISPTQDLIVTQQIWGVALIGLSLVAFKLREAEGNSALIGIAKTFLVITALGIIVTVYHFTLGYTGIAIYLNILISALAFIGILLKAK